MNYFNTQRVTHLTIFLLVLMNLGALTMFWMTRRPGKVSPPGGARPIEQFLQQELGLTDEQAQQFEALRRQHFQKSEDLTNAIQELRRDMLQEVFASTPQQETLRAIAEKIGIKQAALETIRSRHFLELKSLCQPGQVKKFQTLFHEIYPPEQPHEPGRPPQAARHPQQAPQPPQEAITACQDKSQDSSCQFKGPHGVVTGTCQHTGTRLACTPQGGPAGGPPRGKPNAF